MPLFNWSDKYSVGVYMFDTQHKRLVDLINDLHDAMRAAKGREVLGDTLKGLLDYTRMHFADEERQMTTFSYPDYSAHKVEHERLVAKVVELKGKHDAGDNTITIETMNFLKDWLINHILVTDKKYGQFFKDRGIV
ncbi:MAG: hemerythrin family protein [Deltaproteobacteria bacterium]|nr:hemerythrin family protein [Deltaproteobacteria bacterium]